MARHQFFDEDYAALPACGGVAAHVKAQVHFFKIAMKGNRPAQHARVKKEKGDQTDVRPPLPRVEFDAARHIGRKQGGVNRVIRHHQPTPFGG